jgi:hypothetical protein
MGNRDKRDVKVKKPKKADKQPAAHQAQITEVLPPVEVVRKKKKEPGVDED